MTNWLIYGQSKTVVRPMISAKFAYLLQEMLIMQAQESLRLVKLIFKCVVDILSLSLRNQRLQADLHFQKLGNANVRMEL